MLYLSYKEDVKRGENIRQDLIDKATKLYWELERLSAQADSVEERLNQAVSRLTDEETHAYMTILTDRQKTRR